MSAFALTPIVSRNKQPLIIEALTRLARQLGPGIKLPTTQELSRSLGVTITTLDRAIRKMEERGIVACRKGSGIYATSRVRESAVGLVFGRNIFSSGASPFYSLLLGQCVRRAASHQERFSFFLDAPELNGASDDFLVHRDLAGMLKSGKLDGLLIAARHSEEEESWLRSQNVPVVIASQNSKWSGRVSVDFDNIISLAVQELKKRNCRTVGLFGTILSQQEIFQRHASEAGLSWKKQWIVCFDNDATDPHQHEALGREAAARLTGQGPDLPEGLIVTDDIVARGACSHLTKHNLQIGRDLKIATHSNKGSQALSEWEDVLIRCEIDPQEIVEAMFTLLEAKIAGRADAPDSVIVKARPVPNT